VQATPLRQPHEIAPPSRSTLSSNAFVAAMLIKVAQSQPQALW
jgi:hypothetical protein